jgi:parallel beta-helix repeat protein
VFRGEAGTVLDGQNATSFAFRGWNGSRWVNNVTLRDFTITGYTPPAQNGAIWGGDDLTASTTGWTLDSLDVSYSTNLGVRIGNRMRVLRSVLHHNGTINIGGVGRAVLVDGVESSYANKGCLKDPGFESGGSKFVKTDSLVVRNSFFHHNCGVGLWLDIDNINALLENNRVEDNVREGFCIEISFKTVIRNNMVRRNGWPTDPYRANGWLWDAGIGVHASSDVEIYGNTLDENFNGIVAIQQPRGTAMGDTPSPYGAYVAQNMYVHDNTIYQRTPAAGGDGSGSGGVQDALDTSIFTSRNNRWVRNTYYLGTNARPFAWMDGWRTAAEWRAYGQDVAGSFNP